MTDHIVLYFVNKLRKYVPCKTYMKTPFKYVNRNGHSSKQSWNILFLTLTVYSNSLYSMAMNTLWTQQIVVDPHPTPKYTLYMV